MATKKRQQTFAKRKREMEVEEKRRLKREKKQAARAERALAAQDGTIEGSASEERTDEGPSGPDRAN